MKRRQGYAKRLSSMIHRLRIILMLVAKLQLVKALIWGQMVQSMLLAKHHPSRC